MTPTDTAEPQTIPRPVEVAPTPPTPEVRATDRAATAPAHPVDDSRYQHLLRRYQKYAPRYDTLFNTYTEGTLRECVRLIDQHAPQTRDLLDVCCGTGQLAVRLRPQHPDLHITGVDLSDEMLEEARKRFASDPQMTWQRSPAEDLPFRAGEFDLVTCLNAFHLITEQERALRGFRAVLRPGGRLIIADWNPAYLTMRLMQIIYRLLPGHRRRMHSLKSLTAMIERAGFTIEHADRYRATWFWGMSAIVARA